MLGFLLLAIGLTAGSPSCQFVPPADLSAGKPEWIGPCVDGKANGLGVVRVALAGGGADIFYGLLKAGVPVEGLIGDSAHSGWMVAPAFNATAHADQSLPGAMYQNPRYWKEAAVAARVASQHFAAAGNGASAKFYEAQAKLMDRGPGE